MPDLVGHDGKRVGSDNKTDGMNRHIYRLVAAVLAAITIVSCNDARKSETFRLLEDVDSYIEARPDSALAVLEGIDKSELTSKELEAKYALLLSQALDKNYIDLQSDSIIAPAVRYYENHGTPDERLKMYYYSGRIKQNSGDYEGAMEMFVKGESYGDECEDKACLGRLYKAKMTINNDIFNYTQAIVDANNAAKYYLAGGDSQKYYSTILSLAILYDNSTQFSDEYAKCLAILKENWDVLTQKQKGQYYGIYLMDSNLAKDDRQSTLNAYLNEIQDSTHIRWHSVALSHIELDRPEMGLDALKNALVYNNSENDFKKDASYYYILALAEDKLGNSKEALAAYKNYIKITDEVDMQIFASDTKFIEERHQKEIQLIESERNTERITLISIIAILCAFIIIYFIRRQLQIRTAEKKQLEIEKKRYEQLYADAVAERDALTKMVEDANVKDETKAVIKERLEILNKVIISHITDTSKDNKRAYEELEALIADKESFIESTRLTIEGNNPEFINILRSQGLTDDEINICCLYVMGLKGKDIKTYTSQPGHYKQSAEIRHKLGLSENDTNLSIYLRELLEKEA